MANYAQKVEGIFYADGETVAKLFSFINKKNCSYPHYIRYGDRDLIVIDDNCASVIESQEKDIEGLEQDKDELNSTCWKQTNTIIDLTNKLEELGNKITEFNDTLHWWERKIKI